MRKVERLVNLVALLLETKRPLTAEEIRATVPGYDQTSDEAFHRMFERDKEILRELGIPLEKAPTDVWEAEEGYRISREAFYSQDYGLTPEEVAALAFAARAWTGPLAREARAALAKLSLQGAGEAESGWLVPLLPSSGKNLEFLLKSVAARRSVVFPYRAPGRPVEERKVDPYGLVQRSGSWYLVGRDRVKRAIRVFKLERLAGPARPLFPGRKAAQFSIPEGFSAREAVTRGWAGEGMRVRLALRGTALKRAAPRSEESSPPGPDGWAEASFRVKDLEGFLGWVLSFGKEAVLLSPPEARSRLRAILEEVLVALEQGPREGIAGKGTRPRRAREPGKAVGADRLNRLLLLSSWIIAHPGVSLSELERQLGVPAREVLEDLKVLFLCGLPGYGPADLIEVRMVGDRVWMEAAGYFARPFKLTSSEAAALLAVGRALARIPGLEQAEALRRAVEKLEKGLGPEAEAAARIEVMADEVPEQLKRLRTAVAEGRRILIEYVGLSDAEPKERKVDPWVVFAAGGRWYLGGRCLLAGGERIFRLDRMLRLEVLDEPATPPPAPPSSIFRTPPIYVPSPQDPVVRLELGPRASWFAEYLALEAEEPLEDGGLRITFRTARLGWLAPALLRLGGDFRILDPPELREEVRALAVELLERYRPGEGGARATPASAGRGRPGARGA